MSGIRTLGSLNNKVTIALLLAGFVLGMVLIPQLSSRSTDVRSQASGDPMHRIAVRTNPSGSYGEFFDTRTSLPVLFRGNNDFRVSLLRTVYDPTLQKNISTYNIADFRPAYYDRSQRAQVLNQMKSNGYNAVRIFIDQWFSIDKSTNMLDETYLKNVADYLKLAQAYHIYVLVTFRRFPNAGVYKVTNDNPSLISPEAPYHEEYLLPKYIDAKKHYVSDFLKGLKRNNAPFSTVLGWSVDNEPNFQSDKAPMSLTANVVDAPNGNTYRLSVPDDKQKMMADAFSYLVSEVRTVIRQIDPEALVGISLGNPAFGSATNFRMLPTIGMFTASHADYFDVHIYPGFHKLADEIAAYQTNQTKKPIVLGEFGAYPIRYPDIDIAGAVLRDLQIATCKQYHFQGWFTYDYAPPGGPEYDATFPIYHAIDSGGAINSMLAPIYRPDPCAAPLVPTPTKRVSVTPPKSTPIPTIRPSATPTKKPPYIVTKIFTVSCGANVQAPDCVPKNSSYSVYARVTIGRSRVQFSTYNITNGVDQAINADGIPTMNGTWYTTVNRGNFTGSGNTITNVWTYDAQKTKSWCVKLTVPTCP